MTTVKERRSFGMLIIHDFEFILLGQQYYHKYDKYSFITFEIMSIRYLLLYFTKKRSTELS